MREYSFTSPPKSYVRLVSQVCGKKGERWIADLPDAIAELSSKWNISIGKHFPNLSYNYVAPATLLADGSPVVIKICLPVEDKEFESEAAYLRCLDGCGVVRLLDEDQHSRSLLLERAVPGRNLKKEFKNRPGQAVDAAIGALNRIVRPTPVDKAGLIDLRNWYRKLDDAKGDVFPANYARRAFEIFESSNVSERALIHGDFHHTNILTAGRDGFVVIDPKGVIGSLRYDIAVFLNNHAGWSARLRLADEIESAVLKFSDAFGESPADIKRWAFAQIVLSSYWTFNEGGKSWRRQLASVDIWDV